MATPQLAYPWGAMPSQANFWVREALGRVADYATKGGMKVLNGAIARIIASFAGPVGNESFVISRTLRPYHCSKWQTALALRRSRL